MGAQKKFIPIPVPAKKAEKADAADNMVQKAEIERMKKLLSEKIKDPKLAKKAAQIISEMINSKDS